MKLVLPIGSKHGKWTVIGPRVRNKCLCRCECNLERMVIVTKLNCGRSSGCNSCSAKDESLWRHKFPRHIASSVFGAIRRCTDPDCTQSEDWGGRGILVCEAWLQNPELFAQHLMTLPGHDDLSLMLDRTDNDGHYEPGNLRYVTCEESVANRRYTVRVTYYGVEMTAAKLHKTFFANVPRESFYRYLSQGRIPGAVWLSGGKRCGISTNLGGASTQCTLAPSVPFSNAHGAS